jgi:ribonucleoside-diphosphate reductase beta chain
MTELTVERLGDTPVDDVLATIDVEPPSYRDLYYRWERQQWEASAIDLSEDRRQWTEKLEEGLKRSLLWGLASFYVGEQQVTETLVPFVDAAPTEEQQVFLSTQLVDEARHTLFFDRFYSEALGEEGSDMNERLAAQAGRLNTGFRTLLLEMLPQAAERIRRDPENLDNLVRGITLYHIVIEGVLALTGQRFLLNFMRGRELLPGFRSGFTAIARDESRHVSFGVRFLRQMVAGDRRHAESVREVLDEVVPIGMGMMDPPNGDVRFYEPLPYGPADLTEFARSALSKKLRLIGL